ncbi:MULTISPECIES: hypothetical protein [Alcaligenes]|uniref:hypothetical protein n=1 Tax=Alcaligenes TaxID=507 RepID=UPI0002AABDE5|nr:MULTISPECIES: hypothetical protein [Alcaligenes]EKU29795.1 hypothetical protein C660_12299 [Alcaligenes sp. HPC1271]ERI33799.1 hypothetical protein N879_08120 [Alcaligenes sp. EGD-AK7]UTM00383.1 hypothetical protein MID00_12835 [Alcaligenes sp. NLF5-7]HRO21241.1 hypothetical protein [Alcaligenes phenolicus]HRP12723.1 hypothetical protein [Alcaligenes phenolicus]
MTPKEFDDQIQTQLDVVTKILIASGQNQEKAEAAISALDEMRTRIEARMGTLAQSVVHKIDGAATTHAVEAAKLLQQHFIKADEQAVLAADRYRRAARWLGLKIFCSLTILIFVILGAALLVVMSIIPTKEEIDTRRQEIAAMESRALELEKLGVNLIWSKCSGSLCFRTNEKEGAWGSNGETWRRPYERR